MSAQKYSLEVSRMQILVAMTFLRSVSNPTVIAVREGLERLLKEVPDATYKVALEIDSEKREYRLTLNVETTS